jgi:hypothetical protein
MYTLEIAGRPTAISSAESQDEAEETFHSEWFKSDLVIYETEDRPLWNTTDDLFVRKALPEEIAVFEPAYAKAIRDGDAEPDEEYLVFLVPITGGPGEEE